MTRGSGWISPEKLEEELAGLADVSDRIAAPEEELEQAGGGEQGEVP
jgi:hypothetical protein